MAITPAREFAAFAETLADAARTILVPAAAQLPEARLKADKSYVTETDRAIERRLRAMIADGFPDHGVVGEEYGSENADAEFVWVLDPIDGTAPFVAGIPVYGTLIALAHEGRPIVGIIDHPAIGDRWIGIAGEASTRNGKPARTRTCAGVATAFMTNSNPDFFSAGEKATYERLRSRVAYTQYGGSCLSYGLLASGRTDLAIDGGLDAFDIMAIAAVIEGAGGIITDWQGNPITLQWHGCVIAAGDANVYREARTLLNQ